jgi:hypothetical protein
MKVSFSSTGSFKNLEKFLAKMTRQKDIYSKLDGLAQQGVAALAAATPVSSGLAARSWSYEIKVTPTACYINWKNSDLENGYPVAVMIQLGHGTGTGGYVHGIDYINPALRPVFDNLANAAWKVVTSA